MRIREVTLVGGGAASAAAFSAAAAVVANTPLTLLAAAASISPPRELTFTTNGDMSGVILTIVGEDRRGNTFTELLQLPASATTVRSLGVYSKITSITPSASDANTVSVGYPQRVVSPWFLNDTTGARDNVPTNKIQALTPDAPAVFAAGSVEITEQNAARKPGEQCQPETTTLALAAAGATVDARGAWFRFVNAAATGTFKAAIARPRF